MPMDALPYYGVIEAQMAPVNTFDAVPRLPSLQGPPGRAARTLLHHIVNGTDVVSENEHGVELHTIVSPAVFEILCLFDADDDPDKELTGDDEPDVITEDDRTVARADARITRHGPRGSPFFQTSRKS